MNPKASSTRRRFLCGVVGAGAAVGLGGLGLLDARNDGSETGQSSDVLLASGLKPARRSSRAFGTTVSIEAWHSDQRAAMDAVDAAFGELTLVEQLMSIYRPDSQLCRLNHKKVLDSPHPYFLEVLQAAAAMSQRSDGAFDITVQPLWSAYADAKKGGALPTAAAIENARSAVDWRQVVVEPNRVRLRGTNTQITLNGIAQGYAADRASAALVARGVAHALVDTGEIGTVGGKPDGDAWSVGVQHPRHDDAYLSLARLNGRCLATSGDYATTFSDDFRFNHLFDPRTGQSPTQFASVSIAAPSAMMADALSTAVFVLGIDKGLSLVEATRGADAMVMLKDGRAMATRGFPEASKPRLHLSMPTNATSTL
jgi:thiamine biosynthesis lipoprotein